jgi:hypothetical protein
MMDQRGLLATFAFTLSAGTAVGGIAHLARLGPSVAAMAAVVAGLLIAGSLIGAQLALLVTRRPQWRGAAGRGVSGWAELRRELDRSRRAARPMGLLRIARPPRSRWDGPSIGEDAAEAAAELLRSSDTVWIDAGALYALLPESSGEGAHATVDRLLGNLSIGEVRATVSAFPQDGWTSEVLLAKLHGYQVSGVAFDEMDELKQRQRRQQVREPADARLRSSDDRADREAS